MDWFRSGIRQALLIASVAVLAACGGGGSNPQGTLRVSLTDAPNCRVGNDELAAVWVTVERVRVHQSSNAESNNSGWTDIAINPAKKINLLDLTNGRLEELGTTPIPAGTYSQVRLVLSSDRSGGSGTLNNSVLRVGETTELPLQTPSAAQSGLKIIRPFTVEEGRTVDLVIDFDACRSIVLRGNGSHLLKPVLTATLKHVGSIVGFVNLNAALTSVDVTGVVVSAQKNGEVVRSTTPAANGEFVLAYLDAASSPYDVVITAPGKATAAVVAVPATTAATAISTASAPIVPSNSLAAKADGTVGPAAALAAGASVRALQSIGTAPPFIPVAEIGHVNVNPDDGTYELMLPTAPARLAVFSISTPLPLAFTPQGSKSTYALEASAPGYVTQRTPDPALDVPVTRNFTLTAP